MHFESTWPVIKYSLLIRVLKKFDLLESIEAPPESDFDCYLITHTKHEWILNPPTNTNCVFVCTKGYTFDSHQAITDLLNSKLFKIIVQKHPESTKHSHHQKLLFTTDTSRALKEILSSCIESRKLKSSLKICAVTGTNGKTSITQIAGQLIEGITKTKCAKVGTLGYQQGDVQQELSHPTMPSFYDLTRVMEDCKHNHIEHLVMEATSQGLIEERLGNLAVDVAIYTNLTPDHLDYHQTMEKYRQAKTTLFHRHLTKNGTAVMNCCDLNWRYFIESCLLHKPRLLGTGTSAEKEGFFNFVRTYTLLSDSMYFEAENVVLDKSGFSATIKIWKELKIFHEVQLKCPLLGKFQLENTLLSFASCVGLGFSIPDLADLVSQLKPIPGRLERVQGTRPNPHLDPIVLVDYAHSPDSLEKALHACRALLKEDSSLWCVFGCGGDRDPSKRPVMGNIAQKNADAIVITSDNPRNEDPKLIAEAIVSGIHSCSSLNILLDRKQAIKFAIESAKPKDIILIAGKGHESYQIIGNTKYPMSDFELAASALDSLYLQELTP